MYEVLLITLSVRAVQFIFNCVHSLWSIVWSIHWMTFVRHLKIFMALVCSGSNFYFHILFCMLFEWFHFKFFFFFYENFSYLFFSSFFLVNFDNTSNILDETSWCYSFFEDFSPSLFSRRRTMPKSSKQNYHIIFSYWTNNVLFFFTLY
jgi:hypothetical protein